MANKFLGLDSINVLKQYIDERILELNKRSRLMTIQAYTYCETGTIPETPADGVGGFDINGLTIVYPNGWYSLKTLLSKFESLEDALAQGSIWMSAGVYEGSDNKLGPDIKIEYVQQGEDNQETIVKLTDKITWSTPVKINGQNGVSTRMKYTYSDKVLTEDEIKELSDYPQGVSAENRVEYIWSQSGEDAWQGPKVWATYAENADNVKWRYKVTKELETPSKPSAGDSTWTKNLISQDLSKEYPYMWMSFQIIPAGQEETNEGWSEPILFGHWGMDGDVPDYTKTLYRKGYSDPEISDVEGIIQPNKPEFVEDAKIDDYLVDGWKELPDAPDAEVIQGEALNFNGIDKYSNVEILSSNIEVQDYNNVWFNSNANRFVGTCTNTPTTYRFGQYVSGSSHTSWDIDESEKPAHDWDSYNITYSDTYGFIRSSDNRTLYINSTVPEEYTYDNGVFNYYIDTNNKIYTWSSSERYKLIETTLPETIYKHSYKFKLNNGASEDSYNYNSIVERDLTDISDNTVYVWYDMQLIKKSDKPEIDNTEKKPAVWWQCTFKVNGKTNKVIDAASIGSVKRYNAIDGNAKTGQFTLNLYSWSETQLAPEMSETLVNGWRPSNYNYLPDRPLDLTSPEASLWMITANVQGLDENGKPILIERLDDYSEPIVNGSWSEPVKLTGPRGPIAYDYRIETRYNIGTSVKPKATPKEEEWYKTAPNITSQYPYIWANNHLVCYKMKYGDKLDPETGEYNVVQADSGTVIETYDYFRLSGIDGEDGNRKNSISYVAANESIDVTSFSSTNMYISNSESDVTYTIKLDSITFIDGYTGKFTNIGKGKVTINAGSYKFLGSCTQATTIELNPQESVELVCYNKVNNDKTTEMVLLVIGKDIS